MQDLRVGAELGDYRVLSLAGRGGMGTVYRAIQRSSGRTVALKVIAAALLEDETVLARFKREAMAAALLDHPNLVDVYEAGEAAGVTFIAMRFVEGPDLRQLLRSGTELNLDRTLHLLSQVADGLDAAHRAGLVHRDVKPANILVGAGDHAFLTDFGLMRLASAADGPTRPEAWVGTPDYLAPEQIRGQAVSAATDVYGLGCVLYRVLVGRVPFERDTVDSRIWAHLHARPPAPSLLKPPLRAFDAVVARALAKDPANRYGSAGELMRAASFAAESAPGRQSPRATTPADGGGPGDDTTEAGPRAPTWDGQSRMSSGTLVGRSDELALLSHAVSRASEGSPTITLIGGEAGIGKSRLIQELVAAATARDLQTLSGGCVGLDSGEIPYGPIVAALRGAGGGNVAAAVERLEPSARAELARAMPELGVPLTDVGEPARGAQSRLFELLLGLLRRLAAEVPTVLVIEDIHWADPSTLDFLRYFCARAGREQVAVIATFRTDELAPRDPLRALLAELARSRRVTRIELTRLTRAEVAVLLAEILDAPPPPALVDDIFARSQGNPFFAEELLAMRGPGGSAELPASLRDALTARLEYLSETARASLRTAAVAGRAVDHTLLLAATGVAERELVEALREAVTAHVLMAAGEQLCFRHELVREAVYADLLAAERAYLHRRVATALAAIEGSGNPGELGHHWQAAGEAGLALAAYVEAGIGAARAYAFRDALDHFQRAIELWPRAGETGEHALLDRADLFAHAAEAAWCAGEVATAGALCRTALAEVDPPAEPLRAAAMLERLGRYSMSEPAAALACYARALELLPPAPSAQRARLLGRQGLALTYLDRWTECRRRCEEAVEVARATGARAEEAHAMSTLGVALTFLGRPLKGEPILRRALAIASELGRADDAARAHISLAEILRYLGRVAEALDVAVEGERTARSVGLEHLFGTYLSLGAADDLLHLGRWEDASRRLAAVDPDGLERTSRELWLSVAGRLAVMRGDAHTARGHLEVARTLCSDGRPEQVPFVYGGLAELALWQGRPADARRLVAAGLELVGKRVDALNTPVLLAIGVRAEAEAGLRDGDAALRPAIDAATALVARIEGLLEVEEGESCPPQGRAHLVTSMAELGRLTGEPTPDLWAQAASAWMELAHPYPATYARLRLAETAALHGDGSVARRELSAALGEAVGLGAGFLVREAERLYSAMELGEPRRAEPV